jgi:HKD family nuclease
MQITLLNAKQVGIQLGRLMAKADDFHWAVAWATEMAFAEILLAHKKKIRQLVIGTDFAQTSPALLRKLKTTKNVHVMVGKGDVTFHPKVYCFVDGKKISAIVGSANFTNGGTNRNEESALLLEGSIEDQPLRDILNSVSSWWSDSEEIKEEFLTAYELRWLANQKHRKAIGKPLKIYRPTDISTHPKLLVTSWTNYVKDVKTAAHGSIDKRLAVLLRARQLFDSVLSFGHLQALERKAIAGIIGSTEILDTDLAGLGWGWFGSMKGAGAFKNRIKENDAHLSAALDHIPSVGEVTEDDYVQFAGEFQQAFADSTRQGGVPTASRLLAMKRPDYFVCVDSKNAKRLGADVGFRPAALSLENYWERVVEPVTQARWWNTQRPIGMDGRIWDGRAAMLDVIYYDWE